MQEISNEIEKIKIRPKRLGLARKEIIEAGILGTVKWYNVMNGYGFISRGDNQADVFVHFSGIDKANPDHWQRSLNDGEQVLFNIAKSSNDNINKNSEAVNVTGSDGGEVLGSIFALPRTARPPMYIRKGWETPPKWLIQRPKSEKSSNRKLTINEVDEQKTDREEGKPIEEDNQKKYARKNRRFRPKNTIKSKEEKKDDNIRGNETKEDTKTNENKQDKNELEHGEKEAEKEPHRHRPKAMLKDVEKTVKSEGTIKKNKRKKVEKREKRSNDDVDREKRPSRIRTNSEKARRYLRHKRTGDHEKPIGYKAIEDEQVQKEVKVTEEEQVAKVEQDRTNLKDEEEIRKVDDDEDTQEAQLEKAVDLLTLEQANPSFTSEITVSISG